MSPAIPCSKTLFVQTPEAFPRPHPPPPNPDVPFPELFLSCYLHGVTPSLPFPPALAAHTRRCCRAGRAISSPRRGRSSAPPGAAAGASLSPQQSPPPRPTSSSSPLGPPPAPQGSPSLGRWQLPRWQTCPRPLASSTCPGVSPRYPRGPWRGG